MTGRTRTTKKLAQRINLDYFKALHGIPRWRRILSLIFTVAGLAWLGWYALKGDPRPYNAGRVSRAHAMIAQKCEACHLSVGNLRRTAVDQGCLACHDGPIHHVEQTFAPACSNCHVEHRGVMRLADTSDRACTQCHADLAGRDKNVPPAFAANIRGFDQTHPEFSLLRRGRIDPGTVRLNHALHLKADIRSPRGTVQLKCVDCHRRPGIELVSYEKDCADCHALEFDRRFREPAPHKEPKVVYEFVVQKLTGYIAEHPREISLVDEPDKRLPSRPPQPPARNAGEWVQQRLADAQLLLWRKSCKECHTVSYPNGPAATPEIVKASITTHWLPHSEFDHQPHQMLACTSCHTKATTSKETSDVLIPGIQVCRECHHKGANAAEARCSECHGYHDWSKEKYVAGMVTVP
jgi:hypothetical protein